MTRCYFCRYGLHKQGQKGGPEAGPAVSETQQLLADEEVQRALRRIANAGPQGTQARAAGARECG